MDQDLIYYVDSGAADPFLRRKVIEALGFLHAHDSRLRPHRSSIETQLIAECRGHLRALIDLTALAERRGAGNGQPAPQPVEPPGGRPHLLERLLTDRLDDHTSNLFRLLSLIHPQRDIRAAYQSLLSDLPDRRAHALEYLDNLLTGEVREAVFAVIDDLPIRERLRLAKKIFDLSPAAVSATLRRLASVRPPGDADAAWVTAAALHYICDLELTDLYPAIRRAAERDFEPLVQETTTLLLSRIEAAERPGA